MILKVNDQQCSSLVSLNGITKSDRAEEMSQKRIKTPPSPTVKKTNSSPSPSRPLSVDYKKTLNNGKRALFPFCFINPGLTCFNPTLTPIKHYRLKEYGIISKFPHEIVFEI